MQDVYDSDGEEDEGAYQGEKTECLCFEGKVDEQAEEDEFADRKTTIEVENIDPVFEIMKDIVG